jgi:hypothetical protein
MERYIDWPHWMTWRAIIAAGMILGQDRLERKQSRCRHRLPGKVLVRICHLCWNMV